jgi:lipopolysaccharide transport system ATP-binding protein
MTDLAAEGRTVLFVSHNMSAIARLCSRTVWLVDGRVSLVDRTDRVLSEYWTELLDQGSQNFAGGITGPHDTVFRFKSIDVIQQAREIGRGTLKSDLSITFRIHFTVTADLDELALTIRIQSPSNGDVVHSAWLRNGVEGSATNEYMVEATLPPNVLRGGKYHLIIGSEIPYKEILVQESIAKTIAVHVGPGPYGRYPESAWGGVLPPNIVKWSVEYPARG